MHAHPRTRTTHLALYLTAIIGCARPADIPAVIETPELTWSSIPTNSGVVRIATSRPAGPGPFPALLILHGTHGFANEYVELAKDLAAEGILSFAACWFEGGTGVGRQFITPIACDGGPPYVDAEGSERFRLSRMTIDTLVKTLRAHRDVRSLAAFGHSRGGGAALDYTLLNPNAFDGLILNSAGYPDDVVARAANLAVPVLVMHGEADSASEGGSTMTVIARARRFEEALTRSGVAVEAKYYAGGHNALFTDTAHHRDTVRRVAAFVRQRSTK
jgi:alpha-beta hydrolase superfamily lysophospholipase